MRLGGSVAEQSDREILHPFNDSKMAWKLNMPLSASTVPGNYPQQVSNTKEPC